MRISGYLCALFILFSFGCEKSKSVLDSTDDEQNKSIIGTWEWISSTYYYTQTGQPYVTTPETEGYSTTYIFFENDTIHIFRNDSLELAATYKIDVIKYSNKTESDSMLFIDNFTPATFQIKENILTISTTYVDGPEKKFKYLEGNL